MKSQIIIDVTTPDYEGHEKTIKILKEYYKEKAKDMMNHVKDVGIEIRD